MPTASGATPPAAVGTPSVGTNPIAPGTTTPAQAATPTPAATTTVTPTPGVVPTTPTTDPVPPASGTAPAPVPTTPVEGPGPAEEPVVPVQPGPEETPPAGMGNCTFDVSHELSSAIGTVGIVTWGADIAVESATIEFGIAGQEPTMSAPVDLQEPEYRTLLLGMKGSTDYEFRIVASGGGQTCTSDVFSLTTDPVPNSVPRINVTKDNESAATKGFIVTSAGLGNFGGVPGAGGGGGSPMFIFDTDGDIVWWAEAPSNASRARMDWEGKNMYVMTLNYPESGGQVRRVSMDGLDVDGNVSGLGNTHHDFTVAPGGIVTAITWEGGCNSIVERSPDGSLNTIVQSVEALYEPGGGLGGGGFECHGNAITYQPETDTYVLSDRNPNLFVKFDRQGNLIWQFGGNNPKGTHIQGSWSVNHGHHLLPDGTFVFFNNEGGNPSPIKEYKLDEAASTAMMIWEYNGNRGSATLGDVQRLPNGNTFVTYSNGGTIVEVDAGKNVLQSFSTDSLGYVVFRESLYGPPPK